MKNKSLAALFCAVIAFVATILSSSTASAQPAAAPDAPACSVTPKAGVSAVNVRLRTNETSTRLGIIQSGQSAPAACDATAGSSYTACGGTSSWWIQVTWNNRTGYVAALCVDWYSD